jgi:hypothetical protein
MGENGGHAGARILSYWLGMNWNRNGFPPPQIEKDKTVKWLNPNIKKSNPFNLI